MTRNQNLLKMLNESAVLFPDLNHLIVEYDTFKPWDITSVTSWEQDGPTGIVSHHQQQELYICNWFPSTLFSYKTSGEKIKGHSASFNYPCCIDIDETANLLYIADLSNITVLNPQLDIISSWKLPLQFGSLRQIKIDNNILYLTIGGIHQIFVCSYDGKVINKWGTVRCGSKEGEFDCPAGLTLDNKYVYVCDSANNRIQLLNKQNGKFYYQWAKGNGHFFTSPRTIYYHLSEELFYIGDECSVQLYTKENDGSGLCIQRLGDIEEGEKMNQFNRIYSISVSSDDRLYVCDYLNERIQVFRRRT